MKYQFLDHNKSYDEQYPDHARTSCSDENPVNADADGSGCWRCNAIEFDIGERLSIEVKSLRSQLAEAQQYIYDLTNPETGEVPTLEAQLAEAQKVEEEWITTCSNLTKELAEVEMHYADCMDEEQMLREQLAEAQADLSKVIRDRDMWDKANSEARSEIAELKQKLALNELSNDELARAERYEILLASAQDEIAELKKKLRDLKKWKDKHAPKLDSHKSQIDRLNILIQQLKVDAEKWVAYQAKKQSLLRAGFGKTPLRSGDGN